MKDLTGVLLIFIGLIIGLFTGFGFILTLIGLFMIAKTNENFKIARNAFIGTLIVSIAGFFILVGIGGLAVITSISRGGIVTGMIGVIITLIAIIVATYIFNSRSYRHLMYGCRDLAIDMKEIDLSQNCNRAANGYRNALLATTILSILTAIFCWVPVLNILLMIASIGVGIWYFVMQIIIIVRVWQTYDRCRG